MYAYFRYIYCLICKFRMSNVCLIINTIDVPIYCKDKILNLRIIIVSIEAPLSLIDLIPY